MTPVGETLHGAPTLADIGTAEPVAVARVRNLIADAEETTRTYEAYLEDRWKHRDLHAVWDATINISETSCYIDGLKAALKEFGYG